MFDILCAKRETELVLMIMICDAVAHRLRDLIVYPHDDIAYSMAKSVLSYYGLASALFGWASWRSLPSSPRGCIDRCSLDLFPSCSTVVGDQSLQSTASICVQGLDALDANAPLRTDRRRESQSRCEPLNKPCTPINMTLRRSSNKASSQHRACRLVHVGSRRAGHCY